MGAPSLRRTEARIRQSIKGVPVYWVSRRTSCSGVIVEHLTNGEVLMNLDMPEHAGQLTGLVRSRDLVLGPGNADPSDRLLYKEGCTAGKTRWGGGSRRQTV